MSEWMMRFYELSESFVLSGFLVLSVSLHIVQDWGSRLTDDFIFYFPVIFIFFTTNSMASVNNDVIICRHLVVDIY